VGRNFLHVYYCYSPALSAIIERHETLRAIVRVSLFPLVAYGYWSILIGHGITLAVFLGLFLMLALASFTRMRMGQKQAICKGITS
jgi:hypothetical protein